MIDNLNLGCLYKPSLFSEEQICNILKQIEKALQAIVDAPEGRVVDIDIVTDEEKQKIINEFNDTDTDFPKDKSVVELFEEQVRKTPDNTAVIFKDTSVTYRELNEKSNRIASYIRKKGIQPDDFVAIVAEKSIKMIEGILGIMKAGAAYVPLDPLYPEERNRFILNDCEPKAVLYGKKKLSFESLYEEIDLETFEFSEESTENLSLVNKADDLAYCIYTSGTTGQPKGSLIVHTGIVRLVKNETFVPLDESTIMMQTGSMAFDASTLEVWGILLNGGKLVLPDEDVLLSSENLKKAIESNHVNTLWITSSLFNQMMVLNPATFDSLKYLMTGGEKLSDNRNNG